MFVLFVIFTGKIANVNKRDFKPYSLLIKQILNQIEVDLGMRNYKSSKAINIC